MTSDGMAVGLCDRRDNDVSDSKNLARGCCKVLACASVSTPFYYYYFIEVRRIIDSLHETSS